MANDNNPTVDTTQLFFAASSNEPSIIQDYVLPGESMNETDYSFGNGNKADVQLDGNAEIDDNDVFTYPSQLLPDLSKHVNMSKFMKDVYDIIYYHDQWLEPKYKILYDYYKGRHYSIINKDGNGSTKPDSRLIINYPKQLTDTFCGYDNGYSVKVTQSTGSGNSTKKNSDAANNAQISNYLTMQSFWSASMDLNKMSSIYGRSYLYAYYDGSNIDFLPCSPMDTIVVYDDTVMQRPLFAIRYSIDDNGTFSGMIVTKKGEYHFSPNETKPAVDKSGKIQSVKNKSMISIDHNHPDTRLFYGTVSNISKDGLPVLPIIELPENKGRIGIFADCIGLIDNADLVLSQKANDLKALQRQYMVVTGVKLTKNQIKQIRSAYLLNIYKSKRDALDPNNNDKPGVALLAPHTDDDLQEHQLQHLNDQIYKTAHVVNLDNANNSNDANTATAIRKQYQDMKSKAKIKDANYDRVLRTFFTLMYTFWGFDTNLLGSLQFHHKLDEPANILEECQAFNQIYGKAPLAVCLSILSKVNDPQQMANQMNDAKNQNQASVQKLINNAVQSKLNQSQINQNNNNPMNDNSDNDGDNGDN